MPETPTLPTFRESPDSSGILVTILPDYGGENVYAFWIEDCYTPPVYMVRGDSLEDAWDTFIVSPAPALRHYVLRDDDPYLSDYIPDWNGPAPATLEDVGAAWADGRTSGIERNDNGDLVVTESIRACAWSDRPWGPGRPRI